MSPEQTGTAQTHRSLQRNVLLFVPQVAAPATTRPRGRGDGVAGRALFAGEVGGLSGQVGAGLAGIVVELHQAEDQICRHQLEDVRRVCDHVSVTREANVHTAEEKN